MIQEITVYILIAFATFYLIRVFRNNYFNGDKECDGCAISKTSESINKK